ncbi:10622_t:CDS:2, partial [Dentiscutata erythropus]
NDDEKIEDDNLFKINKISNIENDCKSEVLSNNNMFGRTRRIEIIAKEIFSGLFPKEFLCKKLDCLQKYQLNCQLYAEAV